LGPLKRLRHYFRWKADVDATSVADVPTRIRTRHAVVVGSSIHSKWLVFDCPCRRGHRVVLNLDASHYPMWQITAEYPLTVRPSVDEVSRFGRCHYIIRDGLVKWVHRTE
jgi:alpha-D-ribose 1-methylphosphonate 5-phosphate C-P lyase